MELPAGPRCRPVAPAGGGCGGYASGASEEEEPRADQCMSEELERCGPWGVLCGRGAGGGADPSPNFNRQGAATPLTTGFQAVGKAGKTGEIDGPGKKGNGRYSVLKNEPLELQLSIKTGYIDATLTLSRDGATGRDKMRFQGRLWDQGKGGWGPVQDAVNDVAVSYNTGNDEGSIRWKEGGNTKSESYWGGKAGTRMTIEFGGGYNHDFIQD